MSQQQSAGNGANSGGAGAQTSMDNTTLKTIGLVGGYFICVLASVLIAVFSHDPNITHEVVNTLGEIALGSALAIGAVHLGSSVVGLFTSSSASKAASQQQIPTTPAPGPSVPVTIVADQTRGNGNGGSTSNGNSATSVPDARTESGSSI